MGKLSINGVFSMAMLNNQMVDDELVPWLFQQVMWIKQDHTPAMVQEIVVCRRTGGAAAFLADTGLVV